MPAGDLCTQSDVISYLGDQNLGAAALSVVSFLITQVSAWAQGYCERRFDGIQTLSWTADGLGGDTLPLPEQPVISVTGVTVNGTVLFPSDGSTFGYLADNRSVTIINGSFTRGRKNVQISYTAGYPYTFTPGTPTPGPGDTLTGTPADLRWAVIETVALRYKRRTSLGQNSGNIQGQSISYDSSIAPKDAMVIFNKYKKNTPW